MNKQFYQGLRKDIQIAFNASKSSSTSNVPDNLAEGGISNPVLIGYKKDGKYTITGQYDRVHAIATRARGSSSCPIHEDAFSHARIVRSVNKLPDYHNALVMFCYSHRNNDWDFITLVAEYVWAKMELFIDGWQRFKGTSLKPLKIEKLKSLIFNAMLHFKEGSANRRKLYTTEVLSGLLLISHSNWRRDWGPFWNQMLNILADLEEQSLMLVVRNSRRMEVA